MPSLSLDGQRSWIDHYQGLEEEVKGRHFRLNLPLIEKEPDLGDVNKMAQLEDQVQNHPGDIESIARALIKACEPAGQGNRDVTNSVPSVVSVNA